MFTLLRYLYSLVITLALPFIFFRLLWRSRKVPAYRSRWLERLGVFKNPGLTANGIWLHAVSVGEVVAAVPLINALLAAYPGMPIIVTTTTPTGSERLRQALGDKIFHVYMPYDLTWALKLFLNIIKPRCLIIMETELWPNLLHLCKQKNIPVIIANARLSDKSFAGYFRFKKIISNILNQITYVAAQSQLDAERFILLGMPADKVQAVGNLKFDVKINPIVNSRLVVNNRTILVAASTHAGEEEQVLQAFNNVKKQQSDLLLILVPRHPDRFNTVAKLLEKNNLNYVRRSSGDAISQNVAVLLGDTMGELNIFYSVADIAFVGGSLMPIGGHNLLEPAAFGVPIITGPYYSNFKEITNKLLQADGLRIINNPVQLADQIVEWLDDENIRKQIGVNANAMIEQNRGALSKIMAVISAKGVIV